MSVPVILSQIMVVQRIRRALVPIASSAGWAHRTRPVSGRRMEETKSNVIPSSAFLPRPWCCPRVPTQQMLQEPWVSEDAGVEKQEVLVDVRKLMRTSPPCYEVP